jgi:hypothetical protein
VNVYFGFNLQTHTLLCHEVAKNIQAAEPGSRFAGIMSVKGGPHEKWIRNQSEVAYDLIDTTDALEKAALDYEVTTERVMEWERRLGFPLMDLVIADRDAGHRYVTDGRCIETTMSAHDSHEDLQRFICCFLDTYEDRLTTFRPDLVYIVCIAALPCLALARVCEVLNIPFVVLRSTRIGNRHVLSLNDATERFADIEAAFHRACDEGGPLPELPEECRSYLNSFQTDSPEAPVWATSCSQNIEKLQNMNFFRFYGEMALRLGLACTRRLLPPRNRDLRWKKPFSTFAFQIRQKTAVRRFKSDDFDSPRDDEPFIYFPLHLSPEASTMVLAPDYVNQAALIDHLAMRIPLSHKLYVKEHPIMIGRRPAGFYDRIRRHVNVRLINPLVNSMELARRADLVTSISGTAAWESILMGCPVLMFGESFFSHLGLCHRLSEPAGLGGLIKDIVFNQKPTKHGSDELVRFMKCLYDGSFDVPDCIEAYWGRKIPPGKLNEKEIRVAKILAARLVSLND